MQRDHRIELMYYSHPWTLHTLTPLIDDPARSVLIELAETSMLDILALDPSRRRSGPLHLLRRPLRVDLRALGTTMPHVAAPVILAPNPPRHRDRLIDALRILDVIETGLDQVMLLCHVRHARQFRPLLPLVDRFHFVLDGADPADEALRDCARTLAEDGVLEPRRWGGMHIHDHWLRASESREVDSAVMRHTIAATGI
jgi:hypothetical protein